MSKNVKVGVIGTGAIGSLHATNLARAVAGSEVVAVSDLDRDRARLVAAEVGAVEVPSATELIRRPDVEAVLVATPASAHAEIVLEAVSAGKHVLCEKPLATDAEDAARIVEKEMELGRRVVQVGFMRRFDPGYLEVAAAIDSGVLGTLLFAHMVHRNLSVPDFFDDEMVMHDSFIHEIDATRWLLDEEIISVRVIHGLSTPTAQTGLHDPQFLIMATKSGAVVIVEAFLSNGFGYDVRCEIVGSEGTAELSTPRLSRSTSLGVVAEPIHRTWRERFGDTYRIEAQAWVDSIRTGRPTGASAWDGYAASAVAAAGIKALALNGRSVEVQLPGRPAMYSSPT
ncbi:MAG: Gfo/Idh/MocA family oxidoreductase [Acidimicrobiia bacterium]